MKIVLFIVGLLVVLAHGEDDVDVTETGNTVELSYEETIPGGPAEETEGTIVESDRIVTKHRKAGSQATENQLLPSYCPYTDKEFPSCGLWNKGEFNAETRDDCLKACKEATECDRVSYNAGVKKCRMNVRKEGASGGCTVNSDASNLQANPGWTLYVRQVAEDGGECPGGVGPVGLPEDDFVSGHFCKIVGKSCDVSGAFKTDAKATVFQCKTQCNAYAACAAAIWVRPKVAEPGTKRQCHLLTTRCNSLVADAPEEESTTVTLYRMTRADLDARKADPDSPNAGCPPGSTYYNKEEEVYEDKYCVASKRGKCPTNAGYMYAQDQRFGSWEEAEKKCLAKCSAYPTCGLVEFNVDKHNAKKVACNMRDSDYCKPDQLVQTPDGDEIKTSFRLKPEDEETCPTGTEPDPTTREYSAKFCINYDRVCPVSVISDRKFVTAKNLVDCLKQCNKDADCKSAVFQSRKAEDNCEMISGICTSDQLEVANFRKYYHQIAMDADCPELDCPVNSVPKETAICPETCTDSSDHSYCDILTYRCACIDGFLDHDGKCVAKEDCPQNDCPLKTPSQPIVVGSDEAGNKIYRLIQYTQDEVASGASCGVGGVVQNKKPCANTCENPNAEASCELEARPSCHCGHQEQVWDGKLCRDKSTCA